VKDKFSHQKHLFPYPQSISAGLAPVNPTSSSPSPLFPPQPQPFAEPRLSTIQPPLSDGTISSASIYNNPTTSLPPLSSPSLADSIFPRDSSVTPASIALSSPGLSINPIIAQLRKMTEWSKQKTLHKKEGKFSHSHHNHGHSHFDLKKRLQKKYKDRSNIEAIILADDDDDQDAELPSLKRVQKHKRKSIDSKEVVAPSDLVIIHPTNAAYLLDPMQVQQTALKKYQINRKDKKMGIFRNEDAIIDRPAPFSFRFGPEDAKPSPYRQ